ncbi:hypothetical protein AKO1_002149 [Acrasis kona]|uniref:RWP-RK domain-containing protein n=1 Tax=Acrasis kona TaxID=1008807 RepID=A0AAW2Z9G2_9EUKA
MPPKKLTFIDSDPMNQKPSSRGKRVNVNKDQILESTHLSQQEASRRLNISLSTLKRRYYELDMGKWPSNKSHPDHDTLYRRYKGDLEFILNDSEKNEKDTTSLRTCEVEWMRDACSNDNKK